MLDNNEINEQFASESWEKMRLLLDAEMPVTEDRRKRPLVWIWSRTMGIAASMLLVGMGTWWIAQGNFSSNSNPALIAGPTAIHPESTEQTGLHQASAGEQMTAQVLPEKQHTVSQAVSPSAHLKSPSGGARTSKTWQNPAMGNMDSGHVLKAETAQIAATTPASSTVNLINTTSGDLALTESFPARLPEAGLVQLPGLDLAGVQPGQEAGLAAAAIPVGKNHGGWRQGPELGGIASFPTSLAGFHAGWAAEMPIADGLALRGALRYDFQRQTVSSSDRPSSFFENAMVDFADDPFNPVESAVGAPLVDVDSVSSSTLKMHYAALPLSLSVKLNDRWRAEGGVQVAYLFRAFREGRDEPSSLVTNGTTDLDNYTRSSWYFSNKIQQVAQESFQPWDFALSAGLRYQVARHWNVGISGNYGLLNQASKANGYRIYNRNAVLSLGYYF